MVPAARPHATARQEAPPGREPLKTPAAARAASRLVDASRNSALWCWKWLPQSLPQPPGERYYNSSRSPPGSCRHRWPHGAPPGEASPPRPAREEQTAGNRPALPPGTPQARDLHVTSQGKICIKLVTGLGGWELESLASRRGRSPRNLCEGEPVVLHAWPPPPPPTTAIYCTKARAAAFWHPQQSPTDGPHPQGRAGAPGISNPTFLSKGPSGGLKAPPRTPVPTPRVGATKQPSYPF